MGVLRAMLRTLSAMPHSSTSGATKPVISVRQAPKNRFFFGSKEAGRDAAVIYTLVNNCRGHGIPVEEHFREWLTGLPGQISPQVIASLTPAPSASPSMWMGYYTRAEEMLLVMDLEKIGL